MATRAVVEARVEAQNMLDTGLALSAIHESEAMKENAMNTG